MAQWWGASFTGHKALGSVLGTSERREGRRKRSSCYFYAQLTKRHKTTENRVC